MIRSILHELKEISGPMVLAGHVENGVIILDNGVRLSEGTRVSIVTESPPVAEEPHGRRDPMSEEEHRRMIAELDRIASLPIEGKRDPFSGADHDKVLYGEP
jgi:predicted DNA-binding antitoxin AbrB/MazE fold protein